VGETEELLSSSETQNMGGYTNNINITVNVEGGKATEVEKNQRDSGGEDPASESDKAKQSNELAERVRHQVIGVIIEEQRPGGLLDNTK